MFAFFRYIGCTILLCLTSAVMTGQYYNTQVEGKLELRANTEFIEIVGSAFNKTQINESLRYILSVIKSNGDGISRTKQDQTGRFVLLAGRKINLSKATISTQETARIIVLLLIYSNNNELIGKDRIVLNGTLEEQLEMAKRNSDIINETSPVTVSDSGDGVVLRGVVVEDTKTKPGRDFFNLFSSEYRLKDINGEKIVTIKETLAIANNTQIEIFVGNDKIFQFIIRPQNDFLEAAAAEALYRVANYFERLKRSNIKQSY